MTRFNTFIAKTYWLHKPMPRLLLVVCCLCMASVTVVGQARVNSLSVIQFNRVDMKGKMVFANSSLGAVRFYAIPDATQTGYLNVVAKDEANKDIWVIKNFPVFSRADNYSPSMRELELDFKNLNIRPGTAVRYVKVYYTVTDDLATRIPTGTFTNVPVSVETFSNESTSYYNENISYAGYPGMTARADVNIHNDSFPSVQEHYYGCTPGSFARSIAWLNKKYNLGCTLTPQQIYAILHFKTMLNNPTLNYDTSVARKSRFLDSIARAGGKTGKTEFMDKGNMLGPVATTTTTTTTTTTGGGVLVKDTSIKDFLFDDNSHFNSMNDAANSTPFGRTPPSGGGTSTSTSSGILGEVPSSNGADWLKDNLSGNDVELHFDNHMISITGITCSGGTCTITYRDDEHQDSTGGDTAEKTGEIKGDSVKIKGVWYKIEVLFKESIGPAASRVADVQVPEVELLANKPNPFNNSTIIGIDVKRPLQYKNAELVIRDLHGNLVQRIRLKLQTGLNEIQYTNRQSGKGALVYTLELDGKPIQSRQMYIDK